MAKRASKTAAKQTLNPTHNNLPLAGREKVVSLLRARLLDALDLMMQCKQAHWTIKGPNFAALHELFDEAHEDVRSYVDDIAERAASLGGHVVGTVQAASEGSTLPAFPTDLTDGIKQADALANAMGVFGKHVRAAIETADKAGDAVSADLFTSIARELDKRMWMIESHTQK